MGKEDKTELIMVRVTPRDKEVFEKMAKELDMKVAEFVRAAALMYLVMTLNPHGVKTLVKGVARSVRETMEKLREPGLRRALWGGGK